MESFIMNLTTKFARKYTGTPKTEKTQILNQFCGLSDLKRNTAVKRLLRKSKDIKPRVLKVKRYKRRGPKRRYTTTHFNLIYKCWNLANQICAERIHPMLSEYIGYLKPQDTKKETIQQVKEMSLGSLKKIIRTFPKTSPKRNHKGNSHLYKYIKVKANFGQYAHTPGNVEVDFVEHSGSDCGGMFASTACYVDIFSGWVARTASLGKNLQSVRFMHKSNLKRIYHKIIEFHPDNAPSILSILLEKALGNNNPSGEYELSRSRPYQKNDNAHVEQKNGDKVRQLVGYFRYNTLDQVELLNKIYELADCYDNFFIPSSKLVEKAFDAKGKVIKRIHDIPKTPYKRLMSCQGICQETKGTLREKHDSLNMIELKNEIDRLMVKLTPTVSSLDDKKYYPTRSVKRRFQ